MAKKVTPTKKASRASGKAKAPVKKAAVKKKPDVPAKAKKAPAKKAPVTKKPVPKKTQAAPKKKKAAAKAPAPKKAPAKAAAPAKKAKTPAKAAPAKKVTPPPPAKKAAPAKPPVKPTAPAKPATAKPAPPAKAPVKADPKPAVAPPAPAPATKAAPAKGGRTPKPKEPIIAVMTGLEPLGGPAKTLKRALKERFQQEFYLRATPGSLYDLISSPSGFSEWFCDDVDVSGDEFTFKWGLETQHAECLSRKFGEMIRFRWLDDEDPGAFFELRIRIDPMTNETCLVVTDHAWPKDMEEAKALWESQIHTLARVLGA